MLPYNRPTRGILYGGNSSPVNGAVAVAATLPASRPIPPVSCPITKSI